MDNEKEYPSVDLAYDLAVQSYDSIRQRWDSINSLFHSLLSVAITLTLTIPVLSKALNLSLEAYWVIAALVVFVLAAVFCLWGRLSGTLLMINPQELYEKYLGWSHWKFKKNIIYWAGENGCQNVNTLEKKWRTSVWATGFLCFEVVLVVLWILYP